MALWFVLRKRHNMYMQIRNVFAAVVTFCQVICLSNEIQWQHNGTNFIKKVFYRFRQIHWKYEQESERWDITRRRLNFQAKRTKTHHSNVSRLRGSISELLLRISREIGSSLKLPYVENASTALTVPNKEERNVEKSDTVYCLGQWVTVFISSQVRCGIIFLDV